MGADNPRLLQIIFEPDPIRLVNEFNDDDVEMLISDLKQYAQARLGLTPTPKKPEQKKITPRTRTNPNRRYDSLLDSP